MTRSIRPGRDADAWCAGRWGTRRARTEECAGTVRAEDVYTGVLRDAPDSARPGGTGSVSVLDQRLRWELLPNRIWRCGRLFLICPKCGRRSTRVYMPVTGAPLACRSCWGLSYRSRQNSYLRTGWSAIFGTIGENEARLAGEARRIAAHGRLNARRAILDALRRAGSSSA